MRSRSFFVSAVVSAGAMTASGVEAVNFCVGTTTELRTALQSASANGQDDQIRIKSGTYRAESGDPAVAVFATSEDHALTLRGGYFDVGPLECSGIASDPALTIIDGEEGHAGLRLLGLSGSDAALTVQNLTVTRGHHADDGGGLRVGGSQGYSGDVLVDRVRFVDNVAPIGAGLSGGTAGIYTLRNSVFHGNAATGTSGAASLTVADAPSQIYRAVIGGNTFVANACGGSSSCNAGVRIGALGSARVAVFNNAFVLSEGTDVEFAGSGPADLVNNNLLSFSGTPSFQGGNLMLTDPGFVDLAGGDFRLRLSSPLREAGHGAFDLGALDFDGNPRLNDAQYDIGAFENDEIVFSDGFESVP
jgi:hypothetical protein